MRLVLKLIAGERDAIFGSQFQSFNSWTEKISMSRLIDEIKDKAKKLRKSVVLPDAMDERVLRAARICIDEGIASIILCGNDSGIRSEAQKAKISLEKIRIVDPAQSDRTSDFSHVYFQLRKSKGISFEEAQRVVQQPLFFGAMMVPIAYLTALQLRMSLKASLLAATMVLLGKKMTIVNKVLYLFLF